MGYSVFLWLILSGYCQLITDVLKKSLFRPSEAIAEGKTCRFGEVAG